MSFQENLKKLKQFLGVIRGTEDIREKMSWLFNPSNPLTSSNLTPGQAEFVEDAFLVSEHFPEFMPLRELALKVLATSVSIKGRRVEDAIQYQRASKGMQAPTVGIYQAMKEKVTGKKEDKNVEQ